MGNCLETNLLSYENYLKKEEKKSLKGKLLINKCVLNKEWSSYAVFIKKSIFLLGMLIISYQCIESGDPSKAFQKLKFWNGKWN